MSKIRVCPSELKLVARVYRPNGTGVKVLEPFGGLALHIWYDPTNKVFFVGCNQKVYKYFITTKSDDAIAFAKRELGAIIGSENLIARAAF